MKELVIIGAGDVGKFVAYHFCNSSEFKIIGFLDDDKSKWGKSFNNIPVLGDWTYLKQTKDLAVAIGIANPIYKKRIRSNIKDISGLSFPNLIHPHSWIGEKVSLGKGNIIYPGTMINYETEIEDFVTINMNCSIGHNSTIKEYSSLAPGVCLAGHTSIGEGVEVGISACTIQQIEVGSHSVIAAGSVLIHSVPQGDKVAGNPAKSILQKC